MLFKDTITLRCFKISEIFCFLFENKHTGCHSNWCHMIFEMAFGRSRLRPPENCPNRIFQEEKQQQEQIASLARVFVSSRSRGNAEYRHQAHLVHHQQKKMAPGNQPNSAIGGLDREMTGLTDSNESPLNDNGRDQFQCNLAAPCSRWYFC